MSREIRIGSKYRFAEPGFLGTRPIVEVTEFNQQEKQVTYRYAGLPLFTHTRKADNFLAIYEERVA